MAPLILIALAAAEPLVLDAGPLAAPVLDGMVALTREGSDDPRVSWIKPPHASTTTGWPDPVAGDGLIGGVLFVDVPPGSWQVWFLQDAESAAWRTWGAVDAGLSANGEARFVHPKPATWDAFRQLPRYARNPFPVFEPGETGWERQVVHAHPWHHAEVRVGDAGLRLAAWGLPLQALVVLPAHEDAGLVLAGIDARRREVFHSEHDPSAAWWPTPTLTPNLNVQVGSWQTPPDPAASSSPPEISLAAAPGERVSTVVWLSTDTDASWQQTGDARWTGHEVHWLDANGAYPRYRRPRPTFLRPTDGPLRGRQGVPVGLGLALTLPPDAAGTLTGSIELEVGGTTRQIPYRIRVRELALADLPFPAGFFHRWSGSIERDDPGGLATATALFEQDVRLMREHGLSALSLQGVQGGPERGLHPGRVETTLFRSLAEQWAAAGGTTLFQWDHGAFRQQAYPGTGPSAIDRPWQEVARTMIEATADVPLDVFQLLYNEEAHKALRRIDDGRTFSRQFQALGARTAAAALGPVEWGAADSYDVLFFHSVPPATAAHVDTLHGLGAEAWAYNIQAGRSAIPIAWAVGADGYLQWQWGPDPADPFDGMHRVHRWAYALPAPDGTVWPTVALEQLSEGLVDARYLATLEREVVRLEAGPRLHRRRAAEGRELLEIARGALDGSLMVPQYDHEGLSGAALSALRDEVGRVAEALAAIGR